MSETLEFFKLFTLGVMGTLVLGSVVILLILLLNHRD